MGEIIGAHGQVQGPSDPVDEEQIYGIVVLGIMVRACWEQVGPIHGIALFVVPLQTGIFVLLKDHWARVF